MDLIIGVLVITSLTIKEGHVRLTVYPIVQKKSLHKHERSCDLSTMSPLKKSESITCNYDIIKPLVLSTLCTNEDNSNSKSLKFILKVCT